MVTTYRHGDKCFYTGRAIDQYGARFFEVKFLEGHNKDKREWTQRGMIDLYVMDKAKIEITLVDSTD